MKSDKPDYYGLFVLGVCVVCLVAVIVGAVWAWRANSEFVNACEQRGGVSIAGSRKMICIDRASVIIL